MQFCNNMFHPICERSDINHEINIKADSVLRGVGVFM